MTGKEMYERKKRLKAERELRNQEAAMMRKNDQDEGELMLLAGIAALEAIADALNRIADKETK